MMSCSVSWRSYLGSVKHVVWVVEGSVIWWWRGDASNLMKLVLEQKVDYVSMWRSWQSYAYRFLDTVTECSVPGDHDDDDDQDHADDAQEHAGVDTDKLSMRIINLPKRWLSFRSWNSARVYLIIIREPVLVIHSIIMVNQIFIM